MFGYHQDSCLKWSLTNPSALSSLPSLDGLRGSTVKSISLADTPVLQGEGEARVLEHLQSLLFSLEVFNGRKL